MGQSNEWDDAVIIALGSNLAGAFPSSRDLLQSVVTRFPESGLRVKKCSRWWRSAAWPDRTAPDYLNAVALVETAAGPNTLMTRLLDLERAFGRRRTLANDSRTLDLDLIAYGRRVLNAPSLILPHPRAADRLFVMGPLAEIAPGWTHPVTGRTAMDLARAAPTGRDAAPEI